jgi:hypothetical protein
MVLLYLEALAAIALSLSILFEVEKEWRWSVRHYQRAALDWLGNFDSSRDEIKAFFATSTAKTRFCGCGAGAGSCSSPQACSVAPVAANGALAIIG